jgi:hypothetical protein
MESSWPKISRPESTKRVAARSGSENRGDRELDSLCGIVTALPES